ncbi:MAG: hypothetical protein KME32_02660 [Mojavia pulchra JT2-VF2]|uniref:Uncharacterized protein n=1 Tax=Mojavia pulchra JT2-VF2 TaxID=287848 RepID=A0A951PVW6_9NOST|nr:hypothetical protein [Mojavia pulchra JT2-VF2]
MRFRSTAIAFITLLFNLRTQNFQLQISTLRFRSTAIAFTTPSFNLRTRNFELGT